MGSPNIPPAPVSTSDTGLEDQDLSTAQEAEPVPMLFGERKLALRWLCRVYNQHCDPAPSDRPNGKK